MASDFGKIAIDVSKDKGYDLAKLGSMIREFETAVKGITDSSKVLSSNLKDLGESYRKEIYFPKGREKDIKNAFDALAKNRAGISDSSPISVSDIMDAPFDSQKVTIRSQRAVARARKLFLENSGYFEETTERDKYNVGVPSMESSVTSKRGATKSLFSAIMGDVRGIDREVTRKQDEQEAIKLAKKQEQIARQEAKKQEQVDKQEARSKIQEAKTVEKAKEKEEKDRENESKKNSISQLKMVGQLFAVYKAIKEVIEWVTKLYALAVKGADKAFGNIVTGNQLGITPTAVSRYGYIDIAKGLKEGTTTNAMGSIQTAFGDITNLDEEKLKKLAIVMGGGVSQMVQSGVGASDPEKFLKEIINTFVRRGLSGVNSLGQQVGQEQAIMNLSTYLGSIDTNIRDIFDRIVVDAMNPLNPQVNAYKKDAWGMFTGSGTPIVSTPDPLEMASLKEARDTFTQFSSMWKQVLDSFQRFIAITFEPAIERMKSALIFLAPAEVKEQYRAEVKMKNMSMRDAYNSYLTNLNYHFGWDDRKQGQEHYSQQYATLKYNTIDAYRKKYGDKAFLDSSYLMSFLSKYEALGIDISDIQMYFKIASALAELEKIDAKIDNSSLETHTVSPLESGRINFGNMLNSLQFKNTTFTIKSKGLPDRSIRYNEKGYLVDENNEVSYTKETVGRSEAVKALIGNIYNSGDFSSDTRLDAIVEKLIAGVGGAITLESSGDNLILTYTPKDSTQNKQQIKTKTSVIDPDNYAHSN